MILWLRHQQESKSQLRIHSTLIHCAFFFCEFDSKMSREVYIHPDQDPTLLRGPDDWSTWKFRMLTKLRALDLEDMILGTRVCPDPEQDPGADIQAWKIDNSETMNIMLEKIHTKIVRQLTNCTTSAQMWSVLCSLFESKSETNRHAITKRFYDCKYESGKIADYIAKVKDLAAACGNVGVEISDSLIVTTILGGLPRTFKTAILTFENKPIAEQTSNELTTFLVRNEMIEEQFKAKSSDLTDKPADDQSKVETAALSHGVRQNLRGQGQRRRDQDQRIQNNGRFAGKCHNCGQRGHRAHECNRQLNNNRCANGYRGRPNNSGDQRYGYRPPNNNNFQDNRFGQRGDNHQSHSPNNLHNNSRFGQHSNHPNNGYNNINNRPFNQPPNRNQNQGLRPGAHFSGISDQGNNNNDLSHVGA